MSEVKGPSIWEPVAALVVLAAILGAFLSRYGHVMLKVVVVGLALGVVGCKSPGAPIRFALLDIDLRTPEQIQAGQAADCAPFQPAAPAAAAEVKTMPLSWWQLLFKALTDIEGRIRILAIERGRVEVLAK